MNGLNRMVALANIEKTVYHFTQPIGTRTTHHPISSSERRHLSRRNKARRSVSHGDVWYRNTASDGMCCSPSR